MSGLFLVLFFICCLVRPSTAPLKKQLAFVDFSGMCLEGVGKVWGTCLEDVWSGLGDMFGTSLGVC